MLLADVVVAIVSPCKYAPESLASLDRYLASMVSICADANFSTRERRSNYLLYIYGLAIGRGKESMAPSSRNLQLVESLTHFLPTLRVKEFGRRLWDFLAFFRLRNGRALSRLLRMVNCCTC